MIMVAVLINLLVFVSPAALDVVAKQRVLLAGAMGNDGFRVEDSGLMSARGGNPLSSAFSLVSASDNGDDWEQLISYGGSRL